MRVRNPSSEQEHRAAISELIADAGAKSDSSLDTRFD